MSGIFLSKIKHIFLFWIDILKKICYNMKYTQKSNEFLKR